MPGSRALPALVVVSPVAVLSPVAAFVPEAAQGIAAVEEALDLLVPWLEPSRSLPLPPATVGALVREPTLRPASPTIGLRGELVETRPALGPTGLRRRRCGTDRGDAGRAVAGCEEREAGVALAGADEHRPGAEACAVGDERLRGGAGRPSSGKPSDLPRSSIPAALLDLARRVALERFATPSEHRSHIPDTPG